MFLQIVQIYQEIIFKNTSASLHYGSYYEL